MAVKKRTKKKAVRRKKATATKKKVTVELDVDIDPQALLKDAVERVMEDNVPDAVYREAQKIVWDTFDKEVKAYSKANKAKLAAQVRKQLSAAIQKEIPKMVKGFVEEIELRGMY